MLPNYSGDHPDNSGEHPDDVVCLSGCCFGISEPSLQFICCEADVVKESAFLVGSIDLLVVDLGRYEELPRPK